MSKEPYIDFKHVRDHANLATILGHYGIAMIGRGANRKALCPFHDDQRPSLSLDLDRGLFHCFGCQAKGNALEFVAQQEGLDRKTGLRQAAMKLAEICGIELAPPKGLRRARKPQEEQTGPSTRNEPSLARNLPLRGAQRERRASTDAVNPPLTFELRLEAEHPYFAQRELDAATIAEFGLGYASRGMMKGRICIPICDEDGQLVAYAGRWAGADEDIPAGEDKYKLPAGFQKTLVLFNLHRVRQSAPAISELVVVEGYFSVMRLHELGIPAVALMGSSIADGQIALLRRMLPELGSIVLLMDGDEPGRKAREVILAELAAHWFVYAPLLPEGAQPDTLPEETLRALLEFA